MAKKNTNKDQTQPTNGLFSESDAKSVELSGYALGKRGSPYDTQLDEPSVPTGVVDIDESVVLPLSSFNLVDPKSNVISQSPSKELSSRFPPIVARGHPSNTSPHRHHRHHRHHHHREHRHHRENYDPRWWYMPLNSVHGPRPVQQYHQQQHRYVAPKWYELQNRR